MQATNRPLFRRLLAAALCLCTAIGFRCKEESEIYFEEENVVQNAGLGIVEGYDALEVAYYAEAMLKASAGGISVADNCGLYTNNPNTHVVTISFGDCATSASYPYKRIRSGKILVQYNNVVGDTLANRTLTFEDYFVSGKRLEGEIFISDIRRDTVDSLLHSVCTFRNFKISFPNGTNVTYNGSHTRVWTFGEGDNVSTNNTYSVTMLTDSLNISGPATRTFKTAIPSPVKLNYACAITGKLAATAGTIQVNEISGMGAGARNVSFGDGTCDNAVSVTTTQRTFGASVL